MKDCSKVLEDVDVVGLDLGVRSAFLVHLAAGGAEVRRGAFRLTREVLGLQFAGLSPCRVVIEAGGTSRWVRSELSLLGHDVVVVSARRVRALSAGMAKTDARDAELLARYGRMDVGLMTPVVLRPEQAHHHMALLRMRTGLVASRTQLINQVRSMGVQYGLHIQGVTSTTFAAKAASQLSELPAEVRDVTDVLLETIAGISKNVEGMDRRIQAVIKQHYPVCDLLMTMPGIGPVISLAFVLTIFDPWRFAKNRDVGAYLGIAPRKSQSGDQQPQLRITKAGDRMLRRLMVTAAHCMLARGADCALKRKALRILGDGSSKARKRIAVTALARAMSVTLLHMWKTMTAFDPHQDLAGRPEAREPKRVLGTRGVKSRQAGTRARAHAPGDSARPQDRRSA